LKKIKLKNTKTYKHINLETSKPAARIANRPYT